MSNLLSWLKTTISSSTSSTSINNQCYDNKNDNEKDEEIIRNELTTLSMDSIISSSSSFDKIEEEEIIDKKSITIIKKIYYYDKNAKQIFLTGDFDQWKGTIPMVKKDNDQGIFTTDIHLISQKKRIYYKFIVDGKWIYDETLPHEIDKDGNINNVIYTT